MFILELSDSKTICRIPWHNNVLYVRLCCSDSMLCTKSFVSVWYFSHNFARALRERRWTHEKEEFRSIIFVRRLFVVKLKRTDNFKIVCVYVCLCVVCFFVSSCFGFCLLLLRLIYYLLLARWNCSSAVHLWVFSFFLFQLYELIAHKLWKLVDEHTITHCIFILSRINFCLN